MKHGFARRDRKTLLEYSIWLQMRQRCNNSKSKAYLYYGGRGIKVCKRWDDFALFYQDMGPKPDGLTLERVDNDGNYEPNNCTWASRQEQSLNKRFAPNPLGHRGIRQKRHVFQARITVNYREIYLGTFKSLDEAVNARRLAETAYARA